MEQLGWDGRVRTAARLRPGELSDPHEAAKAAMATVARRHQALTEEIAELDTALAELVEHAAPPRLLAKQGVATQEIVNVGTSAGGRFLSHLM